MPAFDLRVLSYVAGLELAVDRLRKQCQLLHLEAMEAMRQIGAACESAAAEPAVALRDIQEVRRNLTEVLHDLDDPDQESGSDCVATISFRPLVERVFRRHQRLTGLSGVRLQLELGCEQVVWFPGRLRHILENLISNAMKCNDPTKGEARVQVTLHRSDDGYELRISDNGLGLSGDAQARLFELFDRAAAPHLLHPVVGVAVLKALIEESGGTLTVESVEGQGAAFVAILPRYAMADHLT